MEVWFYHLRSQPLDRALPAILEKAVARGWRVVVETGDERAEKVLDDLLWTYSPESFLPHGLARDKAADRQPIVVTHGPGNPNGAALRLYVMGAEITLDPATERYERVILLFEDRDEAALGAARAQWTRLKADGHALAYWQQSDEGKWEKRS